MSNDDAAKALARMAADLRARNDLRDKVEENRQLVETIHPPEE
jgi:hypothetical protein